MRVVVTGATGNVGTSVLSALAREQAVETVVGIARRKPDVSYPKTHWVEADIVRADLAPHFRGADAVMHLAWLIQPSRRPADLWAVNVHGSTRVFEAAKRAGAGVLVYASSVGAYALGPKDRAVDESWPATGIATSTYSRHKAEVERRLDDFEVSAPGMRVVRLRPALIFKRDAASEIRRLFLGPLAPASLLGNRAVPLVPDIEALRFQAVHSLDAGEAYRQALVRPVRGAFNIAADGVLGPGELATLLRARRVPLSAGLLRSAMTLTWRARLQPAEPGWLDIGLQTPIMETARARTDLGWRPSMSAADAVGELLEGLRAGAGGGTPPLAQRAGGRLRWRELATRAGSR
ncbi:NAD-dependent epimerase/dehydratase family protein [soil metagenome]